MRSGGATTRWWRPATPHCRGWARSRGWTPRCLPRRGRVALCGAVSEYDADGPTPGPRNLFQATANDLTLRGFRGSSHLHRMEDVIREVGGWLRDGRLRYERTIVDGLEHAPDA